MKKWNVCFTVLCIMLLAACIPSKSPLASENEFTDKNLEGEWYNGDVLYTVKLDGEMYKITTGETVYRGTLSKVGEKSYLNVMLATEKGDAKKFFPSSMWQIYQLNYQDGALILYCASPEKTYRPEGLHYPEEKDATPYFTLSAEEMKKLIEQDGEKIFNGKEKIQFTRKPETQSVNYKPEEEKPAPSESE